MELRDYLSVLRRNWLLILASTVLIGLISGAYTERAVPKYASTAQLFVSTQSGDDTSAVYQGSLFSQQRVTSYARLATNRDVAERVRSNLGLASSAEDLRRKVVARAVPETVLLDLTVTDVDPRSAQVLAQAYAEAMVVVITERERPATGQTSPIRASISESASLSDQPVAPRPLRNLALGVMLGLLLGIVAAFARDALDNTVKDEEFVEDQSGAPLLGSFAFDPGAPKRPLISQIEAHSPRVESFRVLRTNLQFVHVDQKTKVLVVTSSLPGEGKTTTATNLALALAENGQRVLLIDADLRRPTVGETLALPTSVGLTTVLLGKVDLDDAIQEHTFEGLSVLTSGALPPNPAEIVQSQAMHQLLDDVRGRFDVVVVDAPPLIPVTDAALLSAQVDATILVIHHGKTTKEQLSVALSRLRGVGSSPAGFVFNKVKRRAAQGYSGYYGAYYGPKNEGATSGSSPLRRLARRA